MSIVCPINPPGHDWANGLVCRWCDATRTVGEAIVEGLASRRGGDERSARVLLDAHRAEVLAEVTAWLTKRAREWRANGHYAEADATSVLASKVARDAVRPNNLRMLPANSFEPDHTYEYGGWTFHCIAVMPHPDGGTPTAVGWIRHRDSGWTPYAYETAQWSADWTDLGEGAR